TWKRGLEALSFGGTKNGALFAEAIVLFNREKAASFEYHLKQSGQLAAKQRFLAAQFSALLEDDLWLKNGQTANLMADELKKLFLKHHLKIAYPVEANEVFVFLPRPLASILQEAGAFFYPWGNPDLGLYRFVTSWRTAFNEIEQLGSILEQGKRGIG
ncbi:MAG: hypothetical protein K0S07_1605, partial [Chlamydiales bacterium]|nr:hypothetical protein [Chlamydiales bacterium]